MNIEGVIIKDVNANKYFAFIRQFPGVCAQADTKKEVSFKIEKSFKAFIEKMKKDEILFNEEEKFVL